MGSIFNSLNVAASGLSAHRLWMDLIAGNIANANTTRTPQGGPFRRQLAVFMEMAGDRGVSGGVKVARVIEDDSELRRAYQPEHPDADADGFVSYPNVDVLLEMVDLIAASRAYEANATVIEAAKSNYMRSLQILQA
ncbi:flagellar basal body rod protein FlgC [bacterium]|nr:flagellar basal body rod protein FlgC [bacterium]